MNNYNDVRNLLDSENIKKQISELEYDEYDLNKTMQNSIGNHGKVHFSKINTQDIIDTAKMLLLTISVATGCIIALNSVKTSIQTEIQNEKSSISNIVSTKYEMLTEEQLQSVVDDAYMLLREGLNSNYYDILIYDIYTSKGTNYLDKVFATLNIMKSSDEKYKYIRSYGSSFEYFKSIGFIDETGKFLSVEYSDYVSGVKREFYKDKFDKLVDEPKTI